MSEIRCNQTTRRTFLAGAAAVTTAGISAAAQAQLRDGPTNDGPPDNRMRRGRYALVERITFGLNSEEMQRFDALGHAGYLAYHLNPEAINDSLVLSKLNQYVTLNMTPYQTLMYAPGSNISEREAQYSILMRRIYGKRQLQERLAELWFDHFSIYTGSTTDYLVGQHMNAIRDNAMGRFRDLLYAVVYAGGVLSYLGNVQNRKGKLNQNFARELMELHTLGSGSAYKEADVEMATKIFSGWSFTDAYNTPFEDKATKNFGKFKFYPENHEDVQGYFLGTTPGYYITAGDGVNQGKRAINLLTASKSTAQNVARKLIEKFVNPTPTDEFVDATASIYTATSGDIKQMLQYILREDVFCANWAPKFKTPVDYVVSCLRAYNATGSNVSNLHFGILIPMKNMPFEWVQPNGYPDTEAAWIGNLRPRWYAGFQFPVGGLADFYTDIFTLFKVREPSQIASLIDHITTGGRMSYTTTKAITGYMGANPSNVTIQEAFSLGLVSNEFQYY